jgi:hypothetical protein
MKEHSRNEDTGELKIDPVEIKLAEYKQKWLNHVSRVEGVKVKLSQCLIKHHTTKMCWGVVV